MQTNFNPVVLKTGEPRKQYIARRYTEDGIDKKDILAEINTPELYSGEAGGSWTRNVIDQATQGLTQGTRAEVPEDATEVSEISEVEIGGVKISVERLAEIRANAAKEVETEQRKLVEQRIMDDAKADARFDYAQAAMSGDETVTLILDAADYIGDIRLDGKIFVIGRPYQVKAKVAAVLRDICSQSWKHQAEIDGKKPSFYNKRNSTISPVGIVSGTQGLRV